jgi:hypothetical protein
LYLYRVTPCVFFGETNSHSSCNVTMHDLSWNHQLSYHFTHYRTTHCSFVFSFLCYWHSESRNTTLACVKSTSMIKGNSVTVSCPWSFNAPVVLSFCSFHHHSLLSFFSYLFCIHIELCNKNGMFQLLVGVNWWLLHLSLSHTLVAIVSCLQSNSTNSIHTSHHRGNLPVHCVGNEPSRKVSLPKDHCLEGIVHSTWRREEAAEHQKGKSEEWEIRRERVTKSMRLNSPSSIRCSNINIIKSVNNHMHILHLAHFSPLKSGIKSSNNVNY